MPMSAALQRAMNDQIQKEFYAHYLYLAMSAWFEERNFEGFAKWMRIQADEERTHAMRIFDFVLDRGGKVRLEAIPEPGAKWKTVPGGHACMWETPDPFNAAFVDFVRSM